MAMGFIDGFDYLVTANLNLKWDSSPGGMSLVTGVYSKGKALAGAQGGTFALTHTLTSNAATGSMAFHFQCSTLANGAILGQFKDGISNQTQVDLRMNTIGQLYCTRNGTTIGTTSSIQLLAGQWYWIEFQAVISSSAGIVNVYVGALSALAETGLNTQSTSNAFFNQLAIAYAVGSGSIYDSFHYWDTTAGDFNSFPYGEHLIDTQLANAVGSNTHWNKGGTTINANNYQQVNEANEDGDTTYVWMTASGAGDIDSYLFTTLQETSGTIGTIAINTISRIDDAGPHLYEHYCLSSGNPGLSSNITPGANYFNYQTFIGFDPNTGSLWTITGRNAAEFGYEFIS